MFLRARGLWPKVAVFGLIVLLLVLFFALDFRQYLSLENLKSRQEQFSLMYRAHPLRVIAVYTVLYIVVTGCSLPGAAVMTLAGGALFGLGLGTLVVSFASSIGATLACAASRYLFRDWVQARFGDRLALINDGMAREGGFYLFSLRLVPVFPFFLINVLMGLAPIPLRTYYWVSQLGMLPATVVYVNAGTQLARIDSPTKILSPGLLLSFALLGLFPMLSRKLLAWLREAGKRNL